MLSDATTVVLRHTAHVPEEFWGADGAGAIGVGWELGLRGLDLHLGSADCVDPAEIETWSASGEGRAYLGGSSAGWADAAVSDGEAEQQARAAQRATTAFYTGFATVRPEGTRRLYAVDPAGLQEVDAWVEQFRVIWEHRLDALGTELARGRRTRPPR